MKLILLFALLFIFGLGACSQYTCPTYSKKDKHIEQEEAIGDRERV